MRTNKKYQMIYEQFMAQLAQHRGRQKRTTKNGNTAIIDYDTKTSTMTRNGITETVRLQSITPTFLALDWGVIEAMESALDHITEPRKAQIYKASLFDVLQKLQELIDYGTVPEFDDYEKEVFCLIGPVLIDKYCAYLESIENAQIGSLVKALNGKG